MRRVTRYTPSVIVGLIILAATVMPAQSIESAGLSREIYHIKGHFLFYGLFSITLYKGSKNYLTPFTVAIVYGIIMENIQRMIPGRSFEYLDIIINSLGALAALLIVWKRSSILPKKLRIWLES